MPDTDITSIRNLTEFIGRNKRSTDKSLETQLESISVQSPSTPKIMLDSLTGRITGFDPVDLGSSPSPASKSTDLKTPTQADRLKVSDMRCQRTRTDREKNPSATGSSNPIPDGQTRHELGWFQRHSRSRYTAYPLQYTVFHLMH